MVYERSMRTKIDAAKLAVSAGCHLVPNGNKKSPLMSLLAGGPSSVCLGEDPIAARKQWIANTKAKGEVFVDKGVEKPCWLVNLFASWSCGR